jgi:membrane associated rhomboid family serine protease
VTVTNFLILVNVLAFVWELLTGINSGRGDLVGYDVTHYGAWWLIFTAAFLHANFVHIGLNMLALYQVGNIVEIMFGKLRFSLLYVIAIVGSGLTIVAFAPDQPTLGASGAIFGLFGALVAVGLRLGKRGRALIGQVLPVIGINLIFTVTVPGISIAAHVGGLITGFVAGLLLYMLPRQPAAPLYAYAAPGANAPAPPYAGQTIEQTPETIEQPPEAAPHEAEDAPPLEVRDPRE